MSQNDNNFVNGTGQAIVFHKQINPKKMSQVGTTALTRCGFDSNKSSQVTFLPLLMVYFHTTSVS